jgi:hypothetical protein
MSENSKRKKKHIYLLHRIKEHIIAYIMKKESIPLRIYHFYLEGFKEMTLGKTLWTIILIKLFIMFFVLKLFFFPNFLGQFDSKHEKQDYVSNELIHRAITP